MAPHLGAKCVHLDFAVEHIGQRVLDLRVLIARIDRSAIVLAHIQLAEHLFQLYIGKGGSRSMRLDNRISCIPSPHVTRPVLQKFQECARALLRASMCRVLRTDSDIVRVHVDPELVRQILLRLVATIRLRRFDIFEQPVSQLLRILFHALISCQLRLITRAPVFAPVWPAIALRLFQQLQVTLCQIWLVVQFIAHCGLNVPSRTDVVELLIEHRSNSILEDVTLNRLVAQSNRLVRFVSSIGHAPPILHRDMLQQRTTLIGISQAQTQPRIEGIERIEALQRPPGHAQ
ncbi:hypothetical protein BamMEX5DRAFT_6384 [Burkholderia ambifaria MEX-5]|uniref:Uncharacterized protein n=1 Tax=Burkholderia ambifaria MEX-5 TaxID=396597 RepID=B1TF18_9BURK|nr:hypothetical protein BamMEX5DRAFT_6384 [Burkholderia ambifaria MEX-5]